MLKSIPFLNNKGSIYVDNEHESLIAEVFEGLPDNHFFYIGKLFQYSPLMLEILTELDLSKIESETLKEDITYLILKIGDSPSFED